MDDSQSQRLQELENKVTTLNRLLEISTQLNSTLPVNQLLSHIMDIAAEITACEAASVLLWNQNTRELFFAATTTDSPINLIGKPVPLDGSIAGTIMRERRIVQVDDAQHDNRVYTEHENDQSFQTHSLLGVPMTVKNRLIGVLEVVNKRHMPWTADDHQYLSTLAAQAAVVIEDAQMVNALQRANEELNELDKLKSDFIAIASHELRTPLGVIMGYASFLQEETRDNAETSEHVQKVMNSALKLRKIIEDLTNLRYLQQKATDLNLAPISVAQVLRDVQFDVMTLLDTKRQHLQIIPAEREIIVNVDRARIVMALTNILNNSIDFTPSNDRILIETLERNDEVWIRVSDNGIGIDPDQLERIFEQFYQVENHMVRHHDGLGIGLSICRALVNAHGGRIWAESDGKDKGATFTVSIPIHHA